MSYIGTINTERSRQAILIDETQSYLSRDLDGSATKSGTISQSSIITTDDVVTPGFKAAQRSGRIIMNDYKSHTVTIDNSGPVAYHHRRRLKDEDDLYVNWEGTRDPYTYCGDFLPVPDLPISSLKNSAISGAHAKITSSDVLALVTLAESRKTVALLESLVKRFSVLFHTYARKRKLLKRKLGTALSSSAELAQLWLEYRYGIRPLVYEINGLAESIQQAGRLRRWSHTFSVSDSSDESDVWTRIKPQDKIDIQRYASHRIDVRAGVVVDLAGRPTKSHFDTTGAKNILSSAWELVPFSFVVDWFLNTSDFVASFEPFAPTVRGSWVSARGTTYRSNRMIRGPYDLDPGNTHDIASMEVGNPWISKTVEYRERIANPSKPLIPELSIRLDFAKALDLIALLRSNWSKLSPSLRV